MNGYTHIQMAMCICVYIDIYTHTHTQIEIYFKEFACTIVQETWVWPLGWEDPLEKEMATHSSILACEISLTEEPDRLQSMGSQRIRHNLATKQQHQFPNTVLLWNIGG